MLASWPVMAFAAGSQPVPWSDEASAPISQDGGQLGAGWQTVRPDSANALGFGLDDGPINPDAALGNLPDGRAVVVYETWVRRDQGMDLCLRVRATVREKWESVGDDISLLPGGQPVPFSGKGVNWPSGQPFWHGSYHLQWGARRFFYGGFWRTRKLALTATRDGRTLLTAVDEGYRDQEKSQLQVRGWKWEKDRWVADYTEVVTLTPGKEGNHGAPQLVVDAEGTVCLLAVREDHQTGQDSQFVFDVHRRKGGKWESLNVDGKVVTNGDFAANGPARLFPTAKGLILGVQGRVLVGKIRQPGLRLLCWNESERKWLDRWGDKLTRDMQNLGLPTGFMPETDNPVWVISRPLLVGMPYRPDEFIWVSDGRLVREPLAEWKAGTQNWNSYTLVWHGKQPLVFAAGFAKAVNATPDLRNQRLHVGLMQRTRGGWQYAGGGPAYARTVHGGHDGIGPAQGVIGKDGSVLVVWGTNMPIHGPTTIWGAQSRLDANPR
jgi:hypothetical protein